MQNANISTFSLTAQVYFWYVLIMKLPNFSNYMTIFHLWGQSTLRTRQE